MHVMTKPWKHPRSGIFYLRREVPEDIRQIIGKREWKVSLRTRDFATARPRFASELIRCEDIFFAAREQLAGRPRVLASDAPKLADRWAQAVLESWESKSEDLTDFLIQPLDGDDATDVQLACDVVDSSSYKARQNAVEGFMKSVLAEHHLPVPDASEPAYRSLVDAFYSRWCDLCNLKQTTSSPLASFSCLAVRMAGIFRRGAAWPGGTFSAVWWITTAISA